MGYENGKKIIFVIETESIGRSKSINTYMNKQFCVKIIFSLVHTRILSMAFLPKSNPMKIGMGSTRNNTFILCRKLGYWSPPPPPPPQIAVYDKWKKKTQSLGKNQQNLDLFNIDYVRNDKYYILFS